MVPMQMREQEIDREGTRAPAVHDLEGPLERVCGFVVAGRGERVEYVGRGHDPRSEEDALRREAPGIALPVHALVMLSSDHRNVTHVLREHEVCEELARFLGMN